MRTKWHKNMQAAERKAKKQLFCSFYTRTMIQTQEGEVLSIRIHKKWAKTNSNEIGLILKKLPPTVRSRYSTVQKQCKRISSNFGYCFNRKIAEISNEILRAVSQNSVEISDWLRKNSSTSQKFAEPRAKFRSDFLFTEAKFHIPDRKFEMKLRKVWRVEGHCTVLTVAKLLFVCSDQGTVEIYKHTQWNKTRHPARPEASPTYRI